MIMNRGKPDVNKVKQRSTATKIGIPHVYRGRGEKWMLIKREVILNSGGMLPRVKLCFEKKYVPGALSFCFLPKKKWGNSRAFEAKNKNEKCSGGRAVLLF